MKRISSFWGILLIAALLAGCAATPPAQPEATSPPAATAPVEQPTSAAPASPTSAQPAPTQPAASTEAPAAAARSGGTLRFGLRAADISNLDPHFASSTQDRTIMDVIYNGLIRYKPGDAAVFEPDLAVALPKAEMMDGKQVWTVELQPGILCQGIEGVDAYELTSADVLYSFANAANTETSAYAGEYTGVSVAAVDDYTVTFTLESPISESLFYPKIANYSGGLIACQKTSEALGVDGRKTHPAGTGPFVFVEYVPQQRLVVEANPDYFRGMPELDGIEFRYIADITSLELGLRSGELDVINGAPDQLWIAQVETDENIAVDVFGVGEVANLYFNPTVPPMDKLEARQAVAYAINRDALLAMVGERVAANVFSPVPAEFLPGGLTEAEIRDLGLDYSYDPDKARELLAAAGVPDGFSFNVNVSEMTGYKMMYEAIQAQLAEVGITMTLNQVDHASWHPLIRENGDALVLYMAWRPNADAYLTRFFHSDSIVVTGAKPDTNFSNYTKLDDLIVQARAELDADKQAQMWKDAQVQLLEEMAVFPIQYQNQVYARNKKVDYGHELKSNLSLNPVITEKTRLTQ